MLLILLLKPSFPLRFDECVEWGHFYPAGICCMLQLRAKLHCDFSWTTCWFKSQFLTVEEPRVTLIINPSWDEKPAVCGQINPWRHVLNVSLVPPPPSKRCISALSTERLLQAMQVGLEECSERRGEWDQRSAALFISAAEQQISTPTPELTSSSSFFLPLYQFIHPLKHVFVLYINILAQLLWSCS